MSMNPTILEILENNLQSVKMIIEKLKDLEDRIDVLEEKGKDNDI